jgi:L-threonylcarbamoyladenylate synthase
MRISLDDLLASPERVAGLRENLSQGGVAAIPTETFYGLAASPWSAQGCERIFALKGRAAEKALPVLVAAAEDLGKLGVDAPAGSLDRFLALWPAALTVIVAVRMPLPCAPGDASLAVRVPAHDRLRRLLSGTGPLTGTSANRSGELPLSSPDAVLAAFGRQIDVLVDGGETPGGRATTIVDARVEPPRVLRAGAFPWPETR